MEQFGFVCCDGVNVVDYFIGVMVFIECLIVFGYEKIFFCNFDQLRSEYEKFNIYQKMIVEYSYLEIEEVKEKIKLFQGGVVVERDSYFFNNSFLIVFFFQ